MNMPAILVTGANGQLGNALRALSVSFSHFRFFFLSAGDLDITEEHAVDLFFRSNRPAYCINCAAFTAVDKAEDEAETAYRLNRDGIALLAQACSKYACRLMHISTDYVFSGASSTPYREEDAADPKNIYGLSKLAGERAAMKHDPGCIIIRTAWVYSAYGSNFVKTMLKLMKERESVNVVNDQTGTPTYAVDLANACLSIVAGDNWAQGIYHYTNEGRASWYDFALAIKQMSGADCNVNAIPSSAFPTRAKRPAFSLLDTRKIKSVFAVSAPEWQSALRRCLKEMNALKEA